MLNEVVLSTVLCCGLFSSISLQVEKAVNLVKAKGGKVIKEPALLNGSSKVIAYVEDPDGYKFELSEEATTPEPLHHIMLCVGNLDRSINFYKKVRLIMK